MRGRLINLFWIFIEKGGLIVLSLATFYIFALYLSPEQYGEAIFALAMVEFIAIFLCSMWNDPLVRTEYDLDIAYSSVFWFGGAIAVATLSLLLALIYLVQQVNVLFILVAVASIKVLAGVWARPFVAQMRRDKNFKRLAVRTLIGKVLGASVSIILVLNGVGPIAVIMQLVVMEVFSLIALMLHNTRHIRAKPDFVVFKAISYEGIPVAIRQILTNSLVRGIILVLGLTTTKSAVGYFAFASKLIELPFSAFVMGLRSYAMPVFVNRNNDLNRLNTFITQLTIATSFIFVPIFVVGCFIAPLAISWLFGGKWDEAIYLFQIIVILTAVRLLVLYHSMCMIALGKASVGVTFEVVNVMITIAAVFVLVPVYGVFAGVYALTINVLLDYIIKIVTLSKVLKSDIRDHIKGCLGIVTASVSMAAAIVLSEDLTSNELLSLTLSVSLGIVVYLLVLTLFKINLKKSVLSVLKS